MADRRPIDADDIFLEMPVVLEDGIWNAKYCSYFCVRGYRVTLMVEEVTPKRSVYRVRPMWQREEKTPAELAADRQLPLSDPEVKEVENPEGKQ